MHQNYYNRPGLPAYEVLRFKPSEFWPPRVFTQCCVRKTPIWVIFQNALFYCTLCTDSPGGSTDAFARLVSFAQITWLRSTMLNEFCSLKVRTERQKWRNKIIKRKESRVLRLSFHSISFLWLALYAPVLNTPFTRSSKRRANVFKIHVLIARRLLDVCQHSSSRLDELW